VGVVVVVVVVVIIVIEYVIDQSQNFCINTTPHYICARSGVRTRVYSALAIQDCTYGIVH
jgi:hypothetical protein